MVSNYITLNASSYSNLFKDGSGRLYVPVNPSVVMYAQFDHVRGIAASAGQAGVSVNKISILNALIEQMVSMKTHGVATAPSQAESLSDAELESLISEYQKEIQVAVAQSAQAGTYGLAGLMPEAGALFSISA